MFRRMGFAIVLNPEPVRVESSYPAANGEFGWKVELQAKLIPLNNPEWLEEAARDYCKRLNDILGKDESGKENMWQVCVHFKCTTKNRKQLALRFHGRLLEELRGFCGETVRFRFQGTLTTKIFGHTIPFTTKPMRVRPYATIAQVADESSCRKFNHAIQAYCEDLIIKVFPSIQSFDIKRITTKEIRFYLLDTYINLPIEGGSLEETRFQLDVLKTIMRHEASSDISILGVDGFKVAAHKCFLIAQSSVLKEMVKKCRFGRIKLMDVSVNCIKALLEYVYTFQISIAVQDSKVAMELFVLATKYEMDPLQDKLAKMMLERRNLWFYITETLDLFLFVRKLGRTSTIDELIGKIAQVLNWNGKEIIMESEGYQRLVVGDLNAAKELCTAMANAN